MPLVVLSALASGAATPASALTPHPPQPPPAAARPLAPPPAPGGGVPEAVAEPGGVQTARTVRPVAPGIRLTSYDRYEATAWLRVDELTVDLGAGTVRADYLSSGLVADRGTLGELAARHDPGPGRRTVAALNGDFFDITGTGAPLGPGIRDGRATHSPAAGAHRAVGFGPGGAGRVLELYFEGTLTLPDGSTHPLGAYNAADVPPGGIGAYTPAWGTADRALTVDGAPAREAVVRGGRVVSVHEGTGSGPVPAGTTVLTGREAGAAVLGALRPGDPVAVAFRPRTGKGPLPRTAVGGRELLVVDGVAQNHDGAGNNTPAPRTAVGFSADGRRMHVLTVDGRQADSGGVTLTGLGRMMRAAGARNALNLDGGGSSTLLARLPGSDALHVENSPSDGVERPVPNGLALTAPDGSGRLHGFRVATATPADTAPASGPVRGGHPERVFPGLTRALTAAGYDETYGPAEGTPRWRTGDTRIGRVDADGVFHALRTGATEVRAELGPARGSLRLAVLGPLARITPTVRRLGLAGASASGAFGLVGHDAQGSSAPVEPADVHLEYDRALFDVRPDGQGSFTVTARAGTGTSGTVTARAGGRTAVVGVTVGLTERPVSTFDDAADWTFSQARATGSVTATPHGHQGTGLELAYDFTRSTATRAAYASPPSPLPLPGHPRWLGLWIRGDGHGAWPTLHLRDATGADHLLRGPHITWNGWRRVSFDVPAAAAAPLTVHRFYLAETSAARQYTGSVAVDGLDALVPPPVELPDPPRVTDPLVAGPAATAARDWRFAVMSDAQFVARDPDGPLVRQARRTLREIRAAGPDLLLVAGDLVDEGGPADLALARRVLTEELGDALPWTYVPGNHEVMGGSIEAFTAEFGPAHRVFDHRGTRFITLDTSSLTLRGGGLEQVRSFRDGLDAAAGDPDVSSVVVVQHVPPRDPAPQQASRLTDRKEAAMVEDWLSAFRRTTGKGAALVGAHAGVFHASRVDGVPYLVNGNSAKSPAGPAGAGGFTGWSLVGVDRVDRDEQAAVRRAPWGPGPDWISVQTRPHTDALELAAPAVLRPGEAAPVRAEIVQAGRRVPVDWPVGADWTGSPRLHIGSPEGARPRHTAAYDPATGLLTALRPGTVRLAVTAGGTTAAADVAVERAAPAARDAA
ncbi:phosphodiester glycosidase family protein [Streptomyces sp. NPDC048001]|uniref:phosphodiester glycosidase family protein n=1 Tax=Streptomyces sp. NPDC048001 TaxID=3365498 RepID=UPI0037246361